MIAALPMYDFAPVRAATDAWWQGIARALHLQGLTDVPDQLTRERAERTWRHRELLFGQVCGYHIIRAHGVRPQLIATPCYDAPGCEGPEYSSVIVVHAENHASDMEDLRGAIAAINGLDSHSGCHILRAMVAPLASRGGRFFGRQIITGSHAGSLEAIEAREADVAAIDTVTFSLIKRSMPEALTSFRVLGRSPLAPAPPYITSPTASKEDIQRIRDALVDALADPDLAACRDELMIRGAKLVGVEQYNRIDEMARIGESAGVVEH
ncbi:MAG: PhnD/SsuA/transferrin family substrate-binding protein [Alphaproteobacteria bacterium]|nr:PhnD/SsuA/transferrin family substrate-binding protein [Alphaproteobacteria bacterium]